MYTTYTYQDWLATPETDRLDLLLQIVESYKTSDDCKMALEAAAYYAGENVELSKKLVLQPVKFEVKDREKGEVTRSIGQKEIQGARVYSNFFFRFVNQQNQFLLGNGVTLNDEATKARLGLGFDHALEQAGERALIQGVCWGFWNVDHLEVIEAVKDKLSGFVALVNEETGETSVGVQYWQIDGRRPLYIRLFEVDGVTVFRKHEGALTVHREKQAYRMTVARDAAGPMVTDASNYDVLPLIPLYANTEQRSELTQAIKSKIDAYDRISSDFVDNLDRANDVYWVLNNFGGSTADMLEMIEQINRLRMVANLSDGTGSASTAEPHAFEVPYNARQTALELLEKALYKDFLALSMDEITGGSLTNVAIQAAMTNLNLKCDRYEWQCFRFVQRVLALIGVNTEEISFKRQTILNRSEIVDDIAKMREYIDIETALEINPYFIQEQIDDILKNVAAEQVAGLPSMQQLEAVVREDE